jgi:hypothetical protein
MAWPLATATAALLAAAPGLSQATPIVVQPGTTAGYLYFPKATQAEELLKADLAKAKADLAKAKADLLKISADLEKLRKDSFDETWDKAPTDSGFSLHRVLKSMWQASLDTSTSWSLVNRVAVLEAKPATTYATGGLYGYCAAPYDDSGFHIGWCSGSGWPFLVSGDCAAGFAFVVLGGTGGLAGKQYVSCKKL